MSCPRQPTQLKIHPQICRRLRLEPVTVGPASLPCSSFLSFFLSSCAFANFIIFIISLLLSIRLLLVVYPFVHSSIHSFIHSFILRLISVSSSVLPSQIPDPPLTTRYSHSTISATQTHSVRLGNWQESAQRIVITPDPGHHLRGVPWVHLRISLSV